MNRAVRELDLEHLDAAGLQQQREDLLAVYTDVYKARLSDPFHSPPRFWERLEAYGARHGFSLVTGRLRGDLIGYTLGYTLPAGSRWWTGFRGDVDPAELTEDGARTFAVNELMVVEQHRRRGYAHSLHDTLLAHRTEKRATLLVRPDNVPARTAYMSWGWHVLGQLQPFEDAPVYDALIRELSPSR